MGTILGYLLGAIGGAIIAIPIALVGLIICIAIRLSASVEGKINKKKSDKEWVRKNRIADEEWALKHLDSEGNLIIETIPPNKRWMYKKSKVSTLETELTKEPQIKPEVMDINRHTL